nr:ComEA family DNA-binding protein [Anaerolineae bacterium]
MNQWLNEHKTVVLTVIGLLLASAIGTLAIRWKPAASIIVQPPQPTLTPQPTATPGPITIYVSGAVMFVDVYELPPGSIVRDAVEAAGGVLPDADIDRINMARSLEDEEHIYVPHIGEEPAPIAESTSGSALEPDYPININTAGLEELDLLPGVGPVIAQRIIEYRETYGPFPDIESIQNVNGIGPATFDDIKDLIAVGN